MHHDETSAAAVPSEHSEMGSSEPASSPRGPAGHALDRRRFLQYVGFGAVSLACSQRSGWDPRVDDPLAWVDAEGSPAWISPAYPVPLPGDEFPLSDAQRLASYEVVDDLVLPEGFRYDIVAQWGDRFGPAAHPEQQIDFGYNNDFTGLVPIEGQDDEFWLMVNHEYLSPRPWLQGLQEVRGISLPEFRLAADPEEPWRFKYGQFSIDDWVVEEGNMIDLFTSRQPIPDEVRDKIRRTCEAGLKELGVSILRVRRRADGVFEVIGDDGGHKRIHGLGAVNVAADIRQANRFTGPAAYLMGGPPRGTFANCSGGTTPWGTFLTCEENYHYEANEEITPEGQPMPNPKRRFGGSNKVINGVLEDALPTPMHLNGLGYGLEEPLDGRHFGWVCEVDPATGKIDKHTHLGRFRHENVCLRTVRGQRLAAYMGDDQRGGHLWKFVSDGVIEDPASPANSGLLEQGTLYVARFDEDFSGRWIAIEPETPLRRPEPEQCFSSHVMVPSRFLGGHVGVGDTERDRPALEVDDWQEIIERFTGKPYAESTLGDLVKAPEATTPEETRQRQIGILSMDAFAMANACGGTPTARPEDIEIHPTDGSVYIAFTDATDGSAGSPDRRIFPDSALKNSRQYGAIFRLQEDGDDPAAETFHWGKFVSSGEVAEQGGGFACADNMVFDPRGNLWMVTDISTTAQNFPNERQRQTGTAPGGKNFPGVFGNNALFMIPTSGPDMGIPRVFAIAPMESEFCGPTFSEDGKSLILSIQHPGEQSGMRRREQGEEVVTHIVHDRENQAFEQERRQPIGSNFPHGERDRAPRPCVVCITRQKS